MFVRVVARADRRGPVSAAAPARFRGVAARVGALVYETGPELVPARTLRDSAAGLVGVPLVVDHPAGGRLDVRPNEQVGRVVAAAFDGDALVVELEITDAATAAALDEGELAELSPGYVADVAAGVQSSRDYAHLALGPAGWGRCGSACSIHGRADGAPQPRRVARMDCAACADPLVWGGYESPLERVRRDNATFHATAHEGFSVRAAPRPGAFPGER